jgi:hypothetical protein
MHTFRTACAFTPKRVFPHDKVFWLVNPAQPFAVTRALGVVSSP